MKASELEELGSLIIKLNIFYHLQERMDQGWVEYTDDKTWRRFKRLLEKVVSFDASSWVDG